MFRRDLSVSEINRSIWNERERDECWTVFFFRERYKLIIDLCEEIFLQILLKKISFEIAFFMSKINPKFL